MVALQAGERLVVNPALKLKFLALETEFPLLMSSATVLHINCRILLRIRFEWPAAQAGLFVVDWAPNHWGIRRTAIGLNN